MPSSASTYEGLATPTETELSMSPISTSSHSSVNGAAAAAAVHEQWQSAAAAAAALPQQAAGYDSYFPVAAGQPEHAVFHKTYHIN